MDNTIVINGVANPERLTFVEVKELADDPGIILYGKDDFLTELKDAPAEGVFIYVGEYSDNDMNGESVPVRSYEHRYPNPVKSSDVVLRVAVCRTKRSGMLEVLFTASNIYD